MSNNSADFGAIIGNTGMVDIRYSTIKDNITDIFPDLEELPVHVIENAGTLTLHASIIENGDGEDLLNCAGAGSIISEGYNLDSDGSCGLDEATDLSDVDPKLNTLTMADPR